jgi:hypothetical protein
MAPSAPAPSPLGHEGKRPVAFLATLVSSTSSVDFSGMKFMRRPCHAEEGKRLYGEEH